MPVDTNNPYKEEKHRIVYAMSFLSSRIPSGEIFPIGPNEGDQFRLLNSDRVYVYTGGGWKGGMALLEMATELARRNNKEFDSVGRPYENLQTK